MLTKHISDWIVHTYQLVPPNMYILNPSAIVEANLHNILSSEDYADQMQMYPQTFDYIVYVNNVPTLQSTGEPIWTRLPGEAAAEFKLFQSYLEQRNLAKGAYIRDLFKVPGSPLTNRTLSSTWLWDSRCAAHDTHLEQAREVTIQHMRVEVVNEHSKKARELFNMCTDYLEENFEMLSPSNVLKAMQIAVDLERVSLGLATTQNAGKQGGGQGVTINMQNVHQGNGTSTTVIGNGSPAQQVSHSPKENTDEETSRLASILNVMNTIGVLDSTSSDKLEQGVALRKEEEVIEVDYIQEDIK